MSGSASAIARTPLNSSSRVEIVSIVADPGSAGAADHRFALAGKIGKIKMTMAVDQQRRSPGIGRHAAEASTKRGNIPLGFGNGVPGVSGAARSTKARLSAGTTS